MKRPKVPCRDCDRRTMTCHGVCREYKEFQKANEAFNAETREAKEDYLKFPPRMRAIQRAIEYSRRKK